jgi:hypothetical protein
VLEYIKSILGIGNVTERGNIATLSVSSRIEVQVLIDIFSKFSSPFGHPNRKKHACMHVFSQPQAPEV